MTAVLTRKTTAYLREITCDWTRKPERLKPRFENSAPIWESHRYSLLLCAHGRKTVTVWRVRVPIQFFSSRKLRAIRLVRYTNIPTWLRALMLNLNNVFVQKSLLSLMKLSREIWSQSLVTMRKYWYIELGLLKEHNLQLPRLREQNIINVGELVKGVDFLFPGLPAVHN